MTSLLILEDDRSNLEVCTVVLSSHGYDISQASNVEEAIAFCRQRPQIDLFICDIALGSSSGTDAALRMCSIHPDAPVLFVSGTPMYGWDKRDKNNFVKLPLDLVDCLDKPFRPTALVAKVRELLEKRARRPAGRTADDGRY
jgi:CheY-like chemotaxis protein